MILKIFINHKLYGITMKTAFSHLQKILMITVFTTVPFTILSAGPMEDLLDAALRGDSKKAEAAIKLYSEP